MTIPSVPFPTTRSNNVVARAWRWYFTQSAAATDDAVGILVWWEIRRVPYNLVVGAAGIASIALWLSIGSLPLMADLANSDRSAAAEPLSVMAAPFLFNICYTAGWVCEITLKQLGVLRAGSILLKLGTGLSLFMVSALGVWWIGALLVGVFSVMLRSVVAAL